MERSSALSEPTNTTNAEPGRLIPGREGGVTTNIKAMRKEMGITATELAKRTGLRQAVLSRYENGKRMPKADTAVKIAKALGTTVEELLN